MGACQWCVTKIGPRGGAGTGGWNWSSRGDRELMESAGGAGPAGASGAPASKKDKEGSKSRSRRRWRKVKPKGECVGAHSSPEGTLAILQGNGD